MGQDSKIEWTDATWNPVRGCSAVSEGCRNCYAMGVAARFSAKGQPYEGLATRTMSGPKWTGKIMLVENALDLPLHWKKPRQIFVNSMSDLFHVDVPEEYIQSVFDVMRRAHWHQFQVLTKRSDRIEAMSPRIDWPENVWMGVSVESAEYAFRIDHLRRTAARIKFLSIEPLIGPVPDLNLAGIDWAIGGGESGHGARPMHPQWARSIRDQCVAAGVPYFFKQWGEWGRVTHYSMVTDSKGRKEFMDDSYNTHMIRFNDAIHLGDGFHLARVGKKAAGRLLDGRTWDEMPEPTQ